MKSEDRIQQECVMEFNNKYPNLRGLLFSVPNGGRRDKREARLLKSTGLYAGVSDLIFLYKTYAFFFELKTETGSQSKQQKDWEKTVTSHGFIYIIIRSEKRFMEVISILIKSVDDGSIKKYVKRPPNLN